MYYLVEGGNKLFGELPVYGAKNCALALLGATVLTNDLVVLTNCPSIVDVENMLLLLKSLGKNVQRNGETVCVSGQLTSTVAPTQIATLIRGSALVLGSCLAKYGKVQLPMPGGCAIGARPMDVHLDGLQRFGADVVCQDGYVVCKGTLVGAKYTLRCPSVGATENLLCASVLAKGTTTLRNCATEPEVVALQRLLIAMGAKIRNVGGTTLVVEGVSKLHGAVFDVIPDRIVGATYLSCAIATGGKLTLTKCNPSHLQSFLQLLQKRFDLKVGNDFVTINANNCPKDYGNIVTAPYPNFPTDMQPLVTALATFSDGGVTTVKETMFENRLLVNAKQLATLGANITVDGNVCTIVGGKLHNANVKAFDLRGGASLIVSTLNASGCSKIDCVQHVNRGYKDLAQCLNSVGAKITVKQD